MSQANTELTLCSLVELHLQVAVRSLPTQKRAKRRAPSYLGPMVEVTELLKR